MPASDFISPEATYKSFKRKGEEQLDKLKLFKPKTVEGM